MLVAHLICVRLNEVIDFSRFNDMLFNRCYLNEIIIADFNEVNVLAMEYREFRMYYNLYMLFVGKMKLTLYTYYPYK